MGDCCAILDLASSRWVVGADYTDQYSFRKTGTMGTLARQAEIGVWVQASGGGGALESPGMSPQGKF